MFSLFQSQKLISLFFLKNNFKLFSVKTKTFLKKQMKEKKKISFRPDPREAPGPPAVFPEEIEEYIATINTAITPEQREKVERIKKQIRGANPREKCNLLSSSSLPSLPPSSTSCPSNSNDFFLFFFLF